MIVALARKLLIVLWRIVTTGIVPADLKLRRIATWVWEYIKAIKQQQIRQTTACRKRSEVVGSRLSLWLQMPLLRLGPPPRSFAADAYVASWSGSFEVHRMQACGADLSAPPGELPSDRSRLTLGGS
jgi:hypothetical protein